MGTEALGEIMERIDKILATLNFGSRKQVHKLLKSKCVTVNGEICVDSALKINIEQDVITVNGQEITLKKNIYIMMNKPQGVLSASRDKNAKTVLDLLPDELKRKGLFPAGRLDKDTEGLMIITDDGDFAHKMLSPNKKVYKKYFAKLDKPANEKTVKAFEQGVAFLDGTVCQPAKLEILEDKQIYVSICEGKFHQVKKMFLACGLEVQHLKRVSIGQLKLDEKLQIGDSRELSDSEKQRIFL